MFYNFEVHVWTLQIRLYFSNNNKFYSIDVGIRTRTGRFAQTNPDPEVKTVSVLWATDTVSQCNIFYNACNWCRKCKIRLKLFLR
jgi:hypothetical protein